MNADEKELEWRQFADRIAALQRRGRRGLRQLDQRGLASLLDSYQSLSADLARARSLGAPDATVSYLNQLAAAAHMVLYGYSRMPAQPETGSWFTAFARAVRASQGHVKLAFLALFIPALVSYLAVVLYPNLAYQIVPPEFYDFQPTNGEHMHEIPSLMRSVTASSIISNNLQVALLAFAMGITFGVGTTWVLVFNGVHLGAVAGWMTHHGQDRALFGWILPHGSTELLAIGLSGAAGYLIAEALLAPGLTPRMVALQQAGKTALTIELGCMVMLLLAGVIEGNVSPSDLGFGPRLAILGLSLTTWAGYFFLAGRPGPPRGKSSGKS